MNRMGRDPRDSVPNYIFIYIYTPKGACPAPLYPGYSILVLSRYVGYVHSVLEWGKVPRNLNICMNFTQQTTNIHNIKLNVHSI